MSVIKGEREDNYEWGDNETLDFGVDDNTESRQGTEEKAFEKVKQTGRSMKRAAHEAAKEVREDFKSGISDSMNEVSKFGFRMYIYAIVAFVMFAAGSTQSIMLLAGWIMLVEKNKELTKMIICTLVLLLTITVAESVWNIVYNLAQTITPYKVLFIDLSILKKGITFLGSVARIIFDAVRVFIGLWGVLKAKKGNYFKIPFVGKLFV